MSIDETTNAGGEDEKEVLTLLHFAVVEGRKEVVAFLLDHGQEVNVVTNKGMTPLHSAAISGQKEIAQLLLENGAKPNVKNSLGGVPLLYAALEDHFSTAKVLLQHGADTNITDNSGGTPSALRRLLGITESCQAVIDSWCQSQREGY